MQPKPFATSSSYPIRTTASIEYFVDGEKSFAAIAEAIETAQKFVYITCAFASLNFRLRPPNQEQLLDLCARTVARGVKVALLVWLPDTTMPDTIPLKQAADLSSRGVLARWDKAKCSGIYLVVPQLACHHQKTFVIDGVKAFVGGINMVQSYWDTQAHSSIDERRVSYDITDSAKRSQEAARSATLPLHDAFSAFTGPAVTDVEANFVERWNGASVSNSTPNLTASSAAPDPQMATRIQVLRTIAPHTYPHCAAGEESIKEAMLNLLSSATDSVYFENQYFFDGDIVAAIRSAAKRGVRIVGLLSRRPDAGEAVGVLEGFLDADSEARLQWTSLNPVIRNYIQIYAPVTTDLPTKDIYVHAKLMIVDDRYVLLGSANIAFTSLEFHSEMCALVDDPTKALALRQSLFAEHLCLDAHAIPVTFSEAALVWTKHGLENKALIEANKAPRSRVIPQSPLSPLDGDGKWWTAS